MVAPVKAQMTINLQKRRDSWEKRVKIAYAHVESMRNNFNIYKNESTRILKRYEEWLEKNNVEPLLDLKQYK